MSNNKKKTLLDVISDSIKLIFSKVDSSAGKVNIVGELVTVLIIFIVTIQPVAVYILKIIQSIINGFLSYHGKSTIPVVEDSSQITTLIICMIFLLVESFLCAFFVNLSESGKEKIENTKKKKR